MIEKRKKDSASAEASWVHHQIKMSLRARGRDSPRIRELLPKLPFPSLYTYPKRQSTERDAQFIPKQKSPLTKILTPPIMNTTMKSNIHPTYFPEAKVICSCGNSFKTGATKEEVRVEICAHCHPFYTGEEKLIDTAGRVEKFKSRRAAATTPKPKKVRVKKQQK